ncbi:hypothetical protein FIBSPDRAFT_293833 [Athelia psychrophila]|uniref:Uncharacterized protein n=1 Tax=Athelia psychrophila TaxID=1759441 RepID=A0A167XG29_9AGAM|nr:hypothetical protein FIBSPDRAFT_293833 [Fibularhizoctonia sp. CBS 109695]
MIWVWLQLSRPAGLSPKTSLTKGQPRGINAMQKAQQKPECCTPFRHISNPRINEHPAVPELHAGSLSLGANANRRSDFILPLSVSKLCERPCIWV